MVLWDYLPYRVREKEKNKIDRDREGYIAIERETDRAIEKERDDK